MTPDFLFLRIILYFSKNFLFSKYFSNFVGMKQKLNIDWIKALIFFIVCGGLYYIMDHLLHLAHPSLMILGVLLLLFVGDHFAAEIDYRRSLKKRKEDKE